MTTDTEAKMDYVMVLKNLQQELDGMEGRRKALLTAIAGMKGLVGEEEQHRLSLGDEPAKVRQNGSGSLHTVPAGLFQGKTATQAYRELIKLWPGQYTAPQIADAFVAGGMVGKTRTELLQHIHSVLKRERDRRKNEAANRT